MPTEYEDLREIRRAIRALLPHRDLVEVRALGAERCGTISGYFDAEHRQVMADICANVSGNADGVYFTLNPVTSELLARAANRCRNWAKHTTGDVDVLRRCWLPLDFDPVRPAGISSTDAEHKAAIKRARDCKKWLRARKFPPLSLVLGDSGNGAHLLIRVNLPNDDASRELVKRCIEAVAFQFSDDAVKVDLTTFNAARIWKLYGTLAAKGDHIPERPHRLARLLEVPEKIRPMKRHRLDLLAATLPTPPQPAAHQGTGHGAFDLANWITEHELPVVAEKDWKGGHIWILNPCPWNPEHANRAAFIIKHASGAIAAGCQHDGCQGKGWHDLRDVYEPHWRQRRGDTPKIAVPEGLPPAIARAFRRGVEQRVSSARRNRP
jgi:hypothetical protein